MKTVRIENDTGHGFGTTITDLKTGARLNGVTRIALEINTTELNVARVELGAAQVGVTAHASFMVADPASGELREVAEIVFADGGRWTA